MPTRTRWWVGRRGFHGVGGWLAGPGVRRSCAGSAIAAGGLGRPRKRPDRVRADKAYDSRRNRSYLRICGVKATISVLRTESEID
ncbi:hypothetical protein GCM10009544_57350 [Streptomyces stramineus]|uniref:Transposase n=1 Tax=Streptomyces stramineus TaxID=173861 RepID=A0ABP3KX78_9ACTN